MSVAEKTWAGCLCDRCGKPYRTPDWPAASLCSGCDLERQKIIWKVLGERL